MSQRLKLILPNGDVQYECKCLSPECNEIFYVRSSFAVAPTCPSCSEEKVDFASDQSNHLLDMSGKVFEGRVDEVAEGWFDVFDDRDNSLTGFLKKNYKGRLVTITVKEVGNNE